MGALMPSPAGRAGKTDERQRGLTLIELMIAIVLLSIILAFAVPSFRTMLMNNRMVSHTHALIGALNLTRSEAVKRSATVTICRNSSNWLNGWTILTGSDCTLSGDEKELSRHAAFEALQQVTSTASSLSYSRKGDLTSASTVLFTFCDERGGPHARAVQVNNAGQVKSFTTKPDGTALVCP